MIQYHVSDDLCLLRLDSPPLHAITFAMLDRLRAAVGRANSDGRVRWIVITGDPGHFSAGADIGIFKEIASAEDAVRTSRVFQEAFWLLEDGAGASAIDAAMVEFGFPMGPLVLADMAGLDILNHFDRLMSPEFPTHGRLSPVAVRLVGQGHLGQKTGGGRLQVPAGRLYST